jgi:CheY-like chemotaxis protein
MNTINGPVSMFVVDDESDIRLLVRMLVEASGDFVVVAEASDGDEAVERVKAAAPDEIDLILLDNRMPRLNGLEAARAILHDSPRHRIILFTAFVDDWVIEQSADIGIKAVISKTDVETLPTLLADLLG